jgi:hypothetical protein
MARTHMCRSVLSARLLNEQLNLIGKIGCCVCLLGSTMVVLHSPKDDSVNSMQELGSKMQQPSERICAQSRHCPTPTVQCSSCMS